MNERSVDLWVEIINEYGNKNENIIVPALERKMTGKPTFSEATIRLLCDALVPMGVLERNNSTIPIQYRVLKPVIKDNIIIAHKNYLEAHVKKYPKHSLKEKNDIGENHKKINIDPINQAAQTAMLRLLGAIADDLAQIKNIGLKQLELWQK